MKRAWVVYKWHPAPAQYLKNGLWADMTLEFTPDLDEAKIFATKAEAKAVSDLFLGVTCREVVNKPVTKWVLK